MSSLAQPRAVLICRPNSHPFQDRTVGLEQSVKIGRSVARSRPNLTNAVFDCKVLSRNHALLWYETGKFYLQDTKSSNGTFINNQRLSKSSEESPPREVSSGDIVQFGVDVMEVTKKVTHGCIVATLQLFLPDGKEAKASSSTMLADKASTTSVQEIYQLNQFIQDALHREQLIESKLSNMSKLIVTTKDGVDSSWKALIEEDRLLTRVDILERQLEVSHKSMNEDKLKSEVVQLHEDKEKYQAIAKEILRKAVQEKMDSIIKVQELETNLTNAEQEKVLLKDLVESSGVELSELAVKYEESQRKSKELVQEMSQSAEKYKEEVEALNKRLKDGESLVADKEKVIDALMVSVDLKAAQNLKEILVKPEGGGIKEGDERPPLDLDPDTTFQISQKPFPYIGEKSGEELREELRAVLLERLEIHNRVCQITELFDNLKAVSNKVQVSEYLMDLIAKVDTEVRQFKNLTQMRKDEDLAVDHFNCNHEKGDDLNESASLKQNILTIPKTTSSPPMESKDPEKLLDDSRQAVNSLQLQNGAVSAEIQDLRNKLGETTKELEYYKIQIGINAGEIGELEGRLKEKDEEKDSLEHRLSQSTLQLHAKEIKCSANDTTIQQLVGEVSALRERLNGRGNLPPDLKDSKLDDWTQTTDESVIVSSSQLGHLPSSRADGSSKQLVEVEEELAAFKEQYKLSMEECLRLERKLTDQNVLGKESNMGALRYIVPLMVFVLAILIAFHPSS